LRKTTGTKWIVNLKFHQGTRRNIGEITRKGIEERRRKTIGG